MPSKYYVYSTLTNSHRYADYKPQTAPGQPLEIKASVLIHGGANRATDKQMTPLGIMTEVNEGEMQILQTVPLFRQHLEEGFIIVKTDKQDPDMVAKDMTARDQSAPLTPKSAVFQHRDNEGNPLIKEKTD